MIASRFTILVIPLLLLALVISAVGCGGGEGTPPEAKEIRDFLNDKHVNAVLWEEWNIFDEWILVVSIYEKSPQLATDYANLRNQEQSLRNRVIANHNAVTGINPPADLNDFWGKLSVALERLICNNCPGPMKSWAQRESAPTIHAEAWLELRGICREHGINMEWPLPRVL